MAAATPTGAAAAPAAPERPGPEGAEPERATPEPASRRPKLVLGLGNPGERYAATRHNLGFRVVEELARRRGATLVDDECACRLARPVEQRLVEEGQEGGGAGLLVAQPQTFMNRSGHAARCLVERWGFAPGDLLVVYDEVALPLGRLRLRPSGGPAGHRGMESVLAELRSDEVPRLRLGIAPAEPPADLVAFVLAPFADDEHRVVEEMIESAADACEAWAGEGAESAMNRFNVR